MKFNTKTIHAGQKPEETSGAVMPPIFQTSTYAQEAPNVNKGYDYARVGNPTRTALEKMIAGLEGADECACFASGCAAIDAVLNPEIILLLQMIYTGAVIDYLPKYLSPWALTSALLI